MEMQSQWLEPRPLASVKQLCNMQMILLKLPKTRPEKNDEIFMSKEQIHQYISLYKPLDGTVNVPGIFNLYVIESSGG